MKRLIGCYPRKNWVCHDVLICNVLLPQSVLSAEKREEEAQSKYLILLTN